MQDVFCFAILRLKVRKEEIVLWIYLQRKNTENSKKLEGHTETETFRGPVIDDLVVEIVHRVHRLDPSRMIYIVNLNR